MFNKTVCPGKDGDKYVLYESRMGNESIVYFTRDLSAKGLREIYRRVNGDIAGKVGIKLHTGEPHGPNIIPRDWVKHLIEEELPRASIIETNTYYKGHSKGGFGGSNKNIGIGCADGQVGKKMIHTTPGSSNMWDISTEEFMERMTESTKAAIDFFGRHVTYVNVMRNMSVDCDCAGVGAAPVVTPNIGIVASTDILAVDQASVDLVYALDESDRHALVERIESRHGLRQLSYMKELGMGNDRYILIDIDNDDKHIRLQDAIQNVKPFAG